ncbi:uncharacterized protein [Populus alba]|uniref:uncharacterized protein isoform X4 n=1 Tax=Populus alba TaxID=43335 RepID=UPI003CC78D1C
MMDSNIQEKVHKVEEFFDGHLKPQLVRAIAERFVKEHRELREEQRTMVNLGSVLYMQVDVPDTHRIFVDVGLGFHVEFTWQSCCPLMTREPRWGINITFNYTTEMTCEPRAFLGCL